MSEDAADALETFRRLGGDVLVEPISVFDPSDGVAGAALFLSGAAQAPKLNLQKGEGNLVFCGMDSQCGRADIRITGSGNLIYFGAFSRPAGSKFHISGDNNVLYFGAFSSAVNIIVQLKGPRGRIVIGDDCMLSSQIMIANSDGHGIYDVSDGRRLNFDRDIFIDRHVWIGRRAIIGKGATIRSDAVIAQGSVVTGDVPERSVFAGVPAKVIREGVTWSRSDHDTLDETRGAYREKKFANQLKALRARISSGVKS